MGHVIVIQFITADGVVEDPNGSQGTAAGGWGYRFGPEAIAGDKFGLGPLLDHGVLLFGRGTWEVFAGLWPGRSGAFPDVMNRSAKVVVSHGLPELGAWDHSSLLDGPLIDGVARLAAARDVIVMGSTGIVHALADADLVDEYRLLVFPTVLGCGARLFERPVELDLVSVEPSGPLALLCYRRAGRSHGHRGDELRSGSSGS